MKTGNDIRCAIQKARRIVVKIGSRVLVQRSGRPDLRRMRELVRQLAALRKDGREVIVVSSGAIGTGMEALKMKARPTALPDLQMAAAVGQTRLMTNYDKLFVAQGFRIGQVLLTHDDLRDRRRHLNIRNTMMNLLRHNIIPIVNENDVVAVDEIKFGDNDLLASLVTLLIQADLLILLTTVDGFRAPLANGSIRRIPFLRGVSEKDLRQAVGKGSEISTGGMSSKLQSAAMAVKAGIPVIIANGRKDGLLLDILSGKDVGTLISFGTEGTVRSMDQRKRWIAFFHRAQGILIVDDGAREAIEKKGRSLLPIGIKDVEGNFDAGSVVNVKTASGAPFARGVVDYSSGQIRIIKGQRTDQIAALLGSKDYDEVIHRDNMVVMTDEVPHESS